MKKYLTSVNIAIFIMICWDALKSYFSLHHPIIQLTVLFPIVMIAINANRNYIINAAFSLPSSIWLLWILYALINTFLINEFQHHRGQNPLIFISSIVIPFLFLLLIITYKYPTYSLIKLLIFSFGFRLILSFIFDDMTTIDNSDISRFGSEFNANAIAIGALFIVMLIAIKRFQFKKIMWFDIILIIMGVIAILLTSSRKAFIALMIFSIGYIYITRSKDSVKNLLIYTILGTTVILGFIYIIERTTLGERFTQTYQKTINADRPEQMFDHRANQYIVGWELFKENPLNGVGLSNYVVESGYSTPLHTEYMIQFAENGIIGSLLFFSFYIFLIKALKKVGNNFSAVRKITELYFLTIAITLSLLLGTWQYNNLKIWVFISLSIRFIYENRKRLKTMPKW